MKARDNAERLVQYLRAHPQPVNTAEIVQAGLMSAIDAAHAIRYGMREGVIERLRFRTTSDQRFRYRWTGVELAFGERDLSFNELLDVWGIARVPPRLACPIGNRHALPEDGPDDGLEDQDDPPEGNLTRDPSIQEDH